jgi:hypothetical protein
MILGMALEKFILESLRSFPAAAEKPATLKLRERPSLSVGVEPRST